MFWRGAVAIALVAIGAAITTTASAQTLYAASVRSIAGGSPDATAGSLYTVSLATGTATFVAPIRLDGRTPIGVTGLAAHPQTGIFYGITSPLSNQPQSLVTVDPNTGNASLIGELKVAGTDISFNRAGILFIWLNQTGQLGLVNLTNGSVTPIGTPQPSGGASAGLAIDASGAAYVTQTGASGTLDSIDLGSGAIKTGPPLTGAPYPAVINSMTFTYSGLLLAVNSNAGSPASTRLVTINVATGAISNIGTLPDDTDGLTFAALPGRGENNLAMTGQTIALLVLGAIALILGVIGWFVGRRPRNTPPPAA